VWENLGIFKFGGLLMKDKLSYDENAFCILLAIAGMTINPETGEIEPIKEETE
jgi:hypothetical protein